MQYLKPIDVMQLCGINRYKLNKWLNEGLEYIKIGRIIRIHPEDLQQFIKQIHVNKNLV